ncbi:MAG: hypothetical protein AAFR96_12895 [Planctomycetota bacterium]
MPDLNETPPEPAISLRLARLAWPAALWALAFFFHMGMTGPRSDDWFFDFTNPTTREAHRSIIALWTTTHYRPLHHMYVPFISTSFADAWWVPVLLASAGHAVAAAMLYRVIRALCVAQPAALTGATLWMLYPVLFEVPLWVAAASTGVATAISLATLLISLRFIRAGSRWCLPIIFVSAYACCAFNEQPAAAFAAIPTLALAARGANIKRRAWRTLAATIAAGLGVGVYLALMFGTLPFIAEGQPSHERGSTSRLVLSLAELETRWNTTKDAANEIMWMPGMFRAAVENGFNTLALGPRHAGWGWAIPWLFALAASAWLAARGWLRSTSTHDPAPPPAVTRVAHLLIAVTVFFAGFVPVLIIRDQTMYARLAYVPAIGLAIGVAAVLDAAATLGRWHRRTRTLGMLAVFLGIVPAAWALATLGIQDGLFRRVVQDRREAAQLRALVPDPPTDAAVIVVRNDHRVTTSGIDRFDGLFPGATTIPWAAPEWARDAYNRWDVWAAPAWFQDKGPIIDATGAGIRLDPLYPPPGVEGDPFLIPWSRAVSIAIRADGSVRVVTAFELEGRIVRHPSLEHAEGVTIAIPVQPGPAEPAEPLLDAPHP